MWACTVLTHLQWCCTDLVSNMLKFFSKVMFHTGQLCFDRKNSEGNVYPPHNLYKLYSKKHWGVVECCISPMNKDIDPNIQLDHEMKNQWRCTTCIWTVPSHFDIFLVHIKYIHQLGKIYQGGNQCMQLCLDLGVYLAIRILCKTLGLFHPLI